MLACMYKHGQRLGDWWFTTAQLSSVDFDHVNKLQFNCYLSVTDLLQSVQLTGSTMAVPCVTMSM